MKIKLSKTQWEKIGQVAGWKASDPLSYSDADIAPAYNAQDEEDAIYGEDDPIDPYGPYKEGYQNGKVHRINDDNSTIDCPYHRDTEEAVIKSNLWFEGWKDGWEGKPPRY